MLFPNIQIQSQHHLERKLYQKLGTTGITLNHIIKVKLQLLNGFILSRYSYMSYSKVNFNIRKRWVELMSVITHIISKIPRIHSHLNRLWHRRWDYFRFPIFLPSGSNDLTYSAVHLLELFIFSHYEVMAKSEYYVEYKFVSIQTHYD